MRFISKGFFRVGSERYARENHTFGITTLRKRHVHVEGNAIVFEFRGKSNKEQRHVVVDRVLARIIREMLASPGARLFRYTDGARWHNLSERDVNDYVRRVTTGALHRQGFPHVGRHACASRRCSSDLGAPANDREAKKNVVLAIRLVSAELGNTPAICRASYVHPIVLARYLDHGETILAARHEEEDRGSVTTPEERALIRFLDAHFPERRRRVRAEDKVAASTRRRSIRRMQSVLAIDSGTTGATCLVIAADGRVLGRGYREITQHYPQPGRVEHDATEILERTLAAAREAIAPLEGRRPPPSASRISARPSCSGIAAPARRWAARSCGRIVAPRRAAPSSRREADEIAERTGLLPDPYFSATKLEWLLARDELRAHAGGGTLAAGTIDSGSIWKLTGGAVHATDPTNASRTMLYDIDAHEWSDELLRAVRRAARDACPRCGRSSGDFGVAHGGCSVVARHPDSRRRGRSAGRALRPGMLELRRGKNTYGTGAFLLLNTGHDARASAGRRTPHHRGLRRRRAAGVRARGRDLHRGRRGAVAARRARHHRGGARRRRRWRAGSSRTMACISFRRSRGSARRTGSPTRAARSSGSRAERRARISCAPRSRRWRTPPRMCSSSCSSERRARSSGCAWMAVQRRTLADAVPGGRARRAGGAAGHGGDDGAGRGGARGDRRRRVADAHAFLGTRQVPDVHAGAESRTWRSGRDRDGRARCARRSRGRGTAHERKGDVARRLDAHCAALDACRRCGHDDPVSCPFCRSRARRG